MIILAFEKSSPLRNCLSRCNCKFWINTFRDNIILGYFQYDFYHYFYTWYIKIHNLPTRERVQLKQTPRMRVHENDEITFSWNWYGSSFSPASMFPRKAIWFFSTNFWTDFRFSFCLNKTILLFRIFFICSSFWDFFLKIFSLLWLVQIVITRVWSNREAVFLYLKKKKNIYMSLLYSFALLFREKHVKTNTLVGVLQMFALLNSK